MSAGGKRKGAGRPKLNPEDRPVPITIRAHASAVAKFEAWRIIKALSQRKAFEFLVKRIKAFD